MAVLNELRTRQMGVPTNGQQEKTPISTLTRPVHKPVSGKRTVLPRAASGHRAPAGQPVNRNLPFMQQATQQAQTQNQLQSTNSPPPATVTSIPGPASIGQNSPGVEALNAFAAQQKTAPLVPGAAVPGVAATDKPKTGG
jgi:hypothetical protein